MIHLKYDFRNGIIRIIKYDGELIFLSFRTIEAEYYTPLPLKTINCRCVFVPVVKK